MKDSEIAANIVIALIDKSRVNSPEDASKAYKTILKAITNPNE